MIEGKEGKRGERGLTGEPGLSALAQLPSGRTESGDFLLIANAVAPGEKVETLITFPVPLQLPFTVEHIEFTKAKTPGKNCVGPGAKPKGFLCIYVSDESNVVQGEHEATKGTSTDPEIEPPVAGTGRFGAILSWEAAAPGRVRVLGSWAITEL